MKYTRYDIKKRHKDNYGLLIVLLSVLIASYVLGSGLSNLFIKNSKPTAAGDRVTQPNTTSEQNIVKENTVKESTQVKVENVIVRYVCIQNGLFASKENAEVLKSKVKEVLNPFSVAEEDKTRILAGIFKEADVQKYTQLLKDKGVETSNIKFEIGKNDKCDAEIVEIINGYVEILSKLLEKDVKSIQTGSFKQYVNSLEAVDSSSKNYQTLDEIKKRVSALPEALTRDKAEENYLYIYNVLKKLTGK